MRLFVYEYTWAQADSSLPESMRIEGLAMLLAALVDFQRVPGVEAVTLSPPEERAAFIALAGSADATLLIAPESHGILAERCRWVEEAGGRLLGPSRAAVELTGDKWRMAWHLRAAGVPTPLCFALVHQPLPFPAVLKPRHGAGSQATFLLRSMKDWLSSLLVAGKEGWPGDMLVQPYVPGVPASVAFLVGPGVALPLLPAQQLLSNDGRFRYLGGSLPLDRELRPRAVRLARRAIDAVPGLHGFVGVDLVLGETDQVIEINPRLTTSYIGLRALAETNLAAAMLRVANGEKVTLKWRPGTVGWRV